MLSKALLRQAFRTNLERVYSEGDGHEAKALAHATTALNSRLSDYLKTQSGVWAAFEPLGFEADIRHALSHATHLQLAYPRVEHDTLKFYAITSRDQLVQNQWHIWEPDPTRARVVHSDDFHGMLIPGLAFDESGNRLGRGRGYYDRALHEILKTNQPLKIGIALDRQIAQQQLPHDAHDIAMDMVITESRTLFKSASGSAHAKGSAS